jgi:hypothetical protein
MRASFLPEIYLSIYPPRYRCSRAPRPVFDFCPVGDRGARTLLGMADDEFLAFQAELNQLEAPATAAVGPRAPQVITAKPQGPTPVKVKEPVALPQPVMGGPRVPVAQWPKPDHLVTETQQDYPRNPMQLVRLRQNPPPPPSARAPQNLLPRPLRPPRSQPARARGKTHPPSHPPSHLIQPPARVPALYRLPTRPRAHPPACPPLVRRARCTRKRAVASLRGAPPPARRPPRSRRRRR